VKIVTIERALPNTGTFQYGCWFAYEGNVSHDSTRGPVRHAVSARLFVLGSLRVVDHHPRRKECRVLSRHCSRGWADSLRVDRQPNRAVKLTIRGRSRASVGTQTTLGSVGGERGEIFKKRTGSYHFVPCSTMLARNRKPFSLKNLRSVTRPLHGRGPRVMCGTPFTAQV
jgi:hypothetical protein